ncbi:Hedgehog/Intein (Hint) domain-containing protein [Bordetella tumbae]|uniref:Hint domain-containing protein n=1 Tax=Bordetella tumbae TaxID=1649139 RepID=UPI0039F100FC
MATYETSYASALNLNADGTYNVLATSDSSSIATEANDDGVFEQGEQLTIDTDINTDQIQTTIVATYQDGYIVYADGGYVLFSNTVPPEAFLPERDTDGKTPALPVCFTAGTLIDTPKGPMAIEALQIGDLVLGSTGYRPVKWIGWRQYVLRSPRFTEADREAIVPVRIKAHALADNVPSHDIVLSPWHHLYIDNVLVKANQLVNGHTIVRESTLSRVTYFHIELDQFDVVCAHNLYSESWADGGNRDFFENTPITMLRPQDQQRRRALRPGFLVLNAKDPLLVDIQQRIAVRAEQSGDDAERTRAA